MLAQGVFLTGMTILIIFNVLGLVALPSQELQYHFLTMSLGGLAIAVGIAVAALAVLGVHAFVEAATFGAEFYLSEYALQIIFGSAMILGILFDIEVGYGFQIGLGLATNAVTFFEGGDFMGIGGLICTTLGIITLIGGLITIGGND